MSDALTLSPPAPADRDESDYSGLSAPPPLPVDPVLADFQAIAQSQAEEIAQHYTHELADGRQSGERVQGRRGWLARPDAITGLLCAFRLGLNKQTACDSIGLDPKTLTRWELRAEENPGSAAALFVRAAKMARAAGQQKRIERIEKSGLKDQFWTANAWLLERTDPEQFALRREDGNVPRVIVQVGVQSGPLNVQVIESAPVTQIGPGENPR